MKEVFLLKITKKITNFIKKDWTNYGGGYNKSIIFQEEA